jgi:hypothetical protein
MSDPADKAPIGAIPVVQADGTVGYLPAALANDKAATEGLKRATDTQIRGAQVKANEAATKRALDAQFSGSLASELEGAVAPALAGAARGLTLGASDALVAKVGGDAARRRLLDYQEYAPIGSAAGELGAIAGAALLGDESTLGAIPNAVGRIGARIGAGSAEALGGGMLARGAGVLARGAVEGGVYGGAATVSEKVIHDAPLTGEALIGGVTQGAAGGMIANGLLHGAGTGLGKLRGAFRPSAEAIDAMAAREFGEAAPGVGKAVVADMEKSASAAIDKRLGPVADGAAGDAAAGEPYRAGSRNTTDAVGDAYLDTVSSGQKRSDLGEIWKSREVSLNNSAARLEDHSRDLQRAITEQQNAAKITDMATFGEAKVNHMDKLVDRAQFEGQADAVIKWMSRAQEEVNLLATDTAVTKLGPAARKEFDGHMSRLGAALKSGDSLELFRAADNAKRFLGRESKFGRRATGLPEAAKAFDALYQGEGGLMHVLEDPAWGQAATAQKAVNASVSEHISFSQKFGSSFVEEYGSTAGRPDYRANSGKVTSFLGQLTKAANDGDAQAVRDMIRTRRAVLDATSTNYDHGAAARTAIGKERTALDRMEATFDKATKEASLINQVKRLQSEEQAQKIGGLIGLATDTISKPVTTLQRLAQMETHAQSVIDKIGLGAKKLAGAASDKASTSSPRRGGAGFFSILLNRAPVAGERTAIAGASAQRREFDRRAVTMAALQANPAALSARVGDALGPFADDAPKATQAATSVALAGLAFLASKMPPSRRDAFSLQPQLQPVSRASDSEISQHTRYVEALDNPSVVLDLARRGSLTPDHVEAVKAVYPQLYNKMRAQLFQELTTSSSPLPYGRRVQLGILLDLPTDATLTPEFVSAIQATYSASEKAGEEPPPPKLSQLDVAGSSMTATQAASGGLDR